MPVKTIYFDESGFTGTALLDPAQPYFSVVSTDLSDPEASELLATSFPVFKGVEFKLPALWRRATHRGGFVRFSEALPAIADRVFIWLVDKRFCVLTKLVDALVEPLVHAQGRDFYADGHAPKFCNYAYAGIQATGGQELFTATIDAYATFAGKPSRPALGALQWKLNLMQASVPRPIAWFYQMISQGAEAFENFHDIDDYDGSFEIQLSSVLASVGHWRSIAQDDFQIIHDASGNFFRQRGMWETVTSPNVPPQIHSGLNGPPLQFPLRVSETIPGDSTDHPAIQFCDVLAGLVCKVHRPPANQADADLIAAISAAGLGHLPTPGIQFYSEMPAGPPRQLDGPDVVDQLAGVMFRDPV